MKKGLLGVGIIAAVASITLTGCSNGGSSSYGKRKRLHLLTIVQTGKQMVSGTNISRNLTRNILILR